MRTHKHTHTHRAEQTGQQVVSVEIEMGPIMLYRPGSKVEGVHLSRAHF